MLLGLLAAVGVVVAKGNELGWGSMPPMVPVTLVLLVAVTVLAWLHVEVVAVVLALATLATVTIFGLSIGFLILPSFVVAVGALVTVIAKRRRPVADA